MDQSERDSSKPSDRKKAGHASQDKATHGSHSKPLKDTSARSEAPSRKPSSAPKKDIKDGKDDKDGTEPTSGDEGASRNAKAHGHEHSEGVDSDAAHGENRSFIIPKKLLEPQSMVDTSANKQQVKQRQVFHENPNIYYLNGESLSRPMALPPTAKVGIVVIIVIAAILAAIAFYMYFDATTNEPAREKARMEEQIGRDVSLDLPDMLQLLELDDAEIDAEMKATGDTYFERSPVGSGEDYEIVKLPSDITLADAAVMYATGVSKLTPSQAASLLNGAWDLMVERSNGLDMVLHYADFKSGNETGAIANAIAAEDLGRGTETDSGDNDGYGNHYTMGTIMINGTIYDWTVSALPLKDVYSISGLPDDAMYVGVRIKAGAEA